MNPDVSVTTVVEVQLYDTRGCFFVGESDTPPEAFIEVFGSLAPVRDSGAYA